MWEGEAGEAEEEGEVRKVGQAGEVGQTGKAGIRAWKRGRVDREQGKEAGKQRAMRQDR